MKHMTIRERYYIEISLKNNIAVKDIAEHLGYTKQAIYAEIKKGTCVQRDTELKENRIYLADYAQRRIEERYKNKGKRKVEGNDPYLKELSFWIKEKRYSPYAAIVKCGNRLSEKSVYNYIEKGWIEGLSVNNLPYAKLKRKHSSRVIPYTKGLSIDERPKAVESRSEYGHWEGDTVYSSRTDRSCLLTLTERKYREEIIIRIKDRTAGSVLSAFNRLERDLGTQAFRFKFRSLTFDNGVEFSSWKNIETCSRSRQRRTTVYFAHPYCSSERGTNENHNRMIRRWIPKGDDFGLYSNDEIKAIELWINSYPRRMFGGKSCFEMQGRTD